MTTAAATKIFADRIGRIEVSATLAITAAALKLKSEGVNLADFGAGEPHFSTPRHIKDAGIKAIEENFTRYTNVAGYPEVRKAIVDRHACDFGSNYTPDECVFTTGGKQALFNAIQVLVDHGDEVVLPVPYWVSFKDIIQNTPSNPSGAVMAPEDLEAIVRLAHKNGIYVLLDECYVYLNFTGEVVSGASFTDCTEHIVVLGSPSKTYAMAGWRAGFALGPKQVIAAMVKLQSQSTSNAASMVQRASIAALTGSQECVREFRADYVKLRDQILAGFKTIPGLTCIVPQGAFYVYPNVSRFIGKGGIRSASDLAAKLLSEAHVVVVPGEAFGTDDQIRLAYAVSHDVIDEGVKRMREYLAKLS